MAIVKRSPSRTANRHLAMDHSRGGMIHCSRSGSTVQHQEEFCGGFIIWEMTLGSDRPAEFGIQSLNSIRNRYEYRGAPSFGWGLRVSGVRVRPSGTRGTGRTRRPMYIMSRELALVAGRSATCPVALRALSG
jgi:hypothetical protein